MSRTVVEEPVSTEERRGVAQKFLADLELKVPALLDNINDKTSTDYASHPDRLYLIGKDGKIAYAGDKGPFGFKPDLLEQAILAETGAKSTVLPNAAQRPERGAEGREGMMARMMQSLPVNKALDADGDGSFSKSEIENAVKALNSLDIDKNGKLTIEELRPTRPGGRNRN